MGKRLLSLIRKEFIQTLRDIPIIMLVLYSFAEIILCGWAITMDVRHIPTAVVDRDQTADSRAFLDKVRQAEAFEVDFYPADEAGLDDLMDRGQVTLGLVIPAGFGRDLAAGKPVTIQAIADGAQTNAALISLGYLQQISARYSTEVEVSRLNRTGLATITGWLPSITNQIRAWYLPEMRYIHFSMVSMVALAIVMLGILLAAASVVREKEAGTLEQLMVTPVRPFELILAKVLPLVFLEVIGLSIGISIGYFVFGVLPHGNQGATLALFFTLSTLAFLASAGIGLWIATVARNLQQSLMISFFILFPVMFLSGTLVPVTAMPLWLQWISMLSPMRHYLSIALAVFLKGVGIGAVWQHVVLLATFTAIIMGIALVRLRRSLV